MKASNEWNSGSGLTHHESSGSIDLLCGDDLNV
jgi:hypothetical protein